MKNETIANDIRVTLASIAANKESERTRIALEAAVYCYGDAPAALEKSIAARDAAASAAAILKRIPAPRRQSAARTIEIAEAIGGTAAQEGVEYSGSTTYRVRWGDAASAGTTTGQGGSYSRRCTYRKTDATHHVTLDPLGVAALVENEAIRIGSKRDGLHLIALYPDGSAVWVRAKGKGITSERGWIAAQGPVCYHSTVSREHAEKGLARKLATEAKERDARLCNGLVATLADAKAPS